VPMRFTNPLLNQIRSGREQGAEEDVLVSYVLAFLMGYTIAFSVHSHQPHSHRHSYEEDIQGHRDAS
jgi:hypothetical protein